MRWSPAVPADLGSFQKSLLASFHSRSPRSPPTTASTLKHYSPLQQNQQRAVSPLATSFDQKQPMRPASKAVSPFAMHFSSLPSSFGPSNNEEDDANEESFVRDDGVKDEEDDEELARMSNYSVKTLTSLAQIPNPHQKLAQRALDKARESFKASADLSRPISPVLPRQGFDGASVLYSTISLSREGTDYTNDRMARYSHMSSSTRSSVLSNGPGAPQPLTAGPPGQRQYKASTLEGTFRALQASCQKTLPSEVDEAQFDINPSYFTSSGPQPSLEKLPPTHSETPDPQDKPMPCGNSSWPSRPQARNFMGPVNRSTSSRNEVKYYDTQTLECIKQYYPLGPPPRYNYEKATEAPDNVRSLQDSFRPVEPKEKQQKDIRHRVAFYAGTQDVFKSFDQRYQDFRHRVYEQQLCHGETSQRAADRQAKRDHVLSSAELGKPYDISIEAVGQLQTHEAAEPLLGMAFSTLARYRTDG